MTVRDWTKLVTVLGVIASASVLSYAGKISSEAAVGLISAALGYVFGNGHGILEGKSHGR